MITTKKCSRCNGEGKLGNGNTCPVCDGEGEVRTSVSVSVVPDKPLKDFSSMDNHIYKGRKNRFEGIKLDTIIIDNKVSKKQIDNFHKQIIDKPLKQKTMAPKGSVTPEERKAQIIKFLEKVFEATSAKTWISVKELSLSKLREQVGLDHNFGIPIMNVLKSVGFLEVEGFASGMKFRRQQQYAFPNFVNLADQVLEERKRIANAYAKKSGDSYSTFKSKIPKENIKVDKGVIIRKRTHFNVDDICYVMNDNVITEMEVVAVEKVRDNEYQHKLKNFRADIVMLEVSNKDCFETAESLVAHLLRKVDKLKN